jgi:hypothetical protein
VRRRTSIRPSARPKSAEHADIDNPWQVIVWIPGPDMRLKLAELLVDGGAGIAKFKDQSRRGSDIYEAHQDLWQISVFIHPDVNQAQTRAVLAKLSKLMGVSWDTERLMLGDTPASSPEHLAAVECLGADYLDDELRRLVAMVGEQVAARGPEDMTHNQLVALARDVRKRMKPSRKRRRQSRQP